MDPEDEGSFRVTQRALLSSIVKTNICLDPESTVCVVKILTKSGLDFVKLEKKAIWPVVTGISPEKWLKVL